MSDAKLIWFDFGADIAIENGDLAPDDGLATAVLISLFTDARAPITDKLPEGETKRRGWWGVIGQQIIGSLLWLIGREKMVNEVAERAREACADALEWLKTDNIAENVEVIATLVRPQSLQIKIIIERGKATGYAYLWDAVEKYTETVVQNTSIKLQFID